MEKPKVGDRVRVLPFLFKLRAKWGGWYPSREEYIGAVGEVVDPAFEMYPPAMPSNCWVTENKDYQLHSGSSHASYEDFFTRNIPEIDIKLGHEYVCVKFERSENRYVPEYIHTWENRAHMFRIDQLEIVNG